jgi:hypothetical protein
MLKSTWRPKRAKCQRSGNTAIAETERMIKMNRNSQTNPFRYHQSIDLSLKAKQNSDMEKVALKQSLIE